MFEGTGNDRGLSGVPGQLIEEVVERGQRLLVAPGERGRVGALGKAPLGRGAPGNAEHLAREARVLRDESIGGERNGGQRPRRVGEEPLVELAIGGSVQRQRDPLDLGLDRCLATRRGQQRSADFLAMLGHPGSSAPL